jgi:heme/copper-type cytochrome/quinol oxidase subunit 2
MRLMILEVCGAIAALLFVTMLAATASHALRCSEGASGAKALIECLWAVVPWVILAACALPAVRRIGYEAAIH